MRSSAFSLDSTPSSPLSLIVMPTFDAQALADIKKAAETAASMLPKLEKQLTALTEKAASLKNVIGAYEQLSGTSMPVAGLVNGQGVRSRRGQVAAQVFLILSEGGSYSEKELRDKLFERFEAKYSRGSVYSALTRGKKEGKYLNVDGKWTLAQQ